MKEHRAQPVWDQIHDRIQEHAREADERLSMVCSSDVSPPPDSSVPREPIPPLPLPVWNESRPLPDAIVEAQERYDSAANVRRRSADIHERQRAIREAWHRLYVSRPEGGGEQDWQWMIGWTCRLHEFARRVVQAGYAVEVERLTGTDTKSRVAVALLGEALQGDEGRLRDLIRTIPAAVAWWSYFESPFPESLFDAASSDAAARSEDEPPKHYLFGWREILDALGLENGETNKRRVAQLNQLNEGPIIVPGQGSHPRVDKSRLIAWWNSLDSRWEELEQRERDRRATAESRHGFGKDGTVFPEIHGAEKCRRLPKR
jgi:hypothetical protein